jgi:hypothetical protein
VELVELHVDPVAAQSLGEGQHASGVLGPVVAVAHKHARHTKLPLAEAAPIMRQGPIIRNGDVPYRTRSFFCFFTEFWDWRTP